MWKELELLADTLGLSQGQLLTIAREIAGNGMLRTIDRLTDDERLALIAELEMLKAKLVPA